MNLLKETKPVARKEHDCNASIILTLGGDPDFFDSISEYRSYIKARENGFKIQKGDRYINQVVISHSVGFYTFKAIPEIHAICLKYGLYDQD